MTSRLDVELVRRGLARARGQAGELVAADRVRVHGRPATKVSQQVDADAPIEVLPGPAPDYVGRGAHKLAGLLDDLAPAGGPRVEGRRCLDAGASTGGFTQVLLARGAREVVAVDVGRDQLAAVLRADPRVHDLAGTSVRGLSAGEVGGPVDLLVADLSFISLTRVLGDLLGLVRTGADLVLLVKPQFEVGRERLGSGGVVREPALRVEAVTSVARSALAHGLAVRAVRASRWPGPSGNVEYFVWLTGPGAGADAAGVPAVTSGAIAPDDVEPAVRRAIEEGPQ